MRLNRSMILVVLASLTICFLGAAYTLWFNPTQLPLVGAGELPVLGAEPPSIKPGDIQKVRLTITDTGIATVSASQLEAAGLSVSDLSSNQFILTANGKPVPFLVLNVGAEPTIYFYAQAEEDPHKPLSVYELRPGAGLAMLEQNAQPFNEGRQGGEQYLDWEENQLFVENGIPGDAWMGDLLMAPSSWVHVLNNVHTDGESSTLTVRLFTNVEAEGNDQHHVDIVVNEQSLAEHYWQGVGQEIIRVPIRAGILNPDQANSIEIIVFDDTVPPGEAIFVDSIELVYEGLIDVSNGAVTFRSDAPNIRIDGTDENFLVFNITDPASPIALNGIRSEGDSAHFSSGAKDSTYIALNAENAVKPTLESIPTWRKSLLDPGWEADYIAIVADVRGFEEAIDPLLLHRRDQGLRIARVSVEQIFDEFGYGRSDPQAIKDFITFARENWGPPGPQFVLLVGDATYDATNMARGKNRNRLPTMLAFTRNGYAADDMWFTTDDENLSQIAIGRFPAQNAPQLRAMVQKTIDYETLLLSSDDIWTQKALLIADDEPRYDEEIAALSDTLSANNYTVYQLHMSYDDNTRHKIMSAIDDGVGLVHYTGAGSEGAWGDEAVLQNSDAQTLRNGLKLPILTTFSSRSASFAQPSRDSLTESLLRTTNGGIIAAVAPSGMVSDEFEPQLTALFYDQFLKTEQVRLGNSLKNMYNAAGDNPLLQEAMAPVNLIGDPALLVHKPFDLDNNEQQGTP